MIGPETANRPNLKRRMASKTSEAVHFGTSSRNKNNQLQEKPCGGLFL